MFDVRDPDSRSRAWNLTDETPYFHNPNTTADFFEGQRKCLYPNSQTGLFEATNKEDAFLISAVSQGFTTDLRPVVSQTKISPCFADILIPSVYYYYVRSSFFFLFATPPLWRSLTEILPLQREGWGPREAWDDPDPIAWDDKINKLYWRGSTSGGTVFGENWRLVLV